jgi:hypothetical protein
MLERWLTWARRRMRDPRTTDEARFHICRVAHLLGIKARLSSQTSAP